MPRHVAHRREGQHLRPCEELVEGRQVELAVGGERDPANLDAALLGQNLPGDDVGVVLHLGQYHDIACCEVGSAPGHRDQIHRLAGVLREHDLVGRRCVDQPGDRDATGLVGLGRFAGEAIRAAIDRGVRRLHERSHRVDDPPGLLGRVARVEVHEARIVDGALGEERELRANLRHVEHVQPVAPARKDS